MYRDDELEDYFQEIYDSSNGKSKLPEHYISEEEFDNMGMTKFGDCSYGNSMFSEKYAIYGYYDSDTDSVNNYGQFVVSETRTDYNKMSGDEKDSEYRIFDDRGDAEEYYSYCEEECNDYNEHNNTVPGGN